MKKEAPIYIAGKRVVTPRQVSDRVSKALGARFSVRQVDRLGDNGVLKPIVHRNRRFYYLSQVDELIQSGAFYRSEKNPGKVRLRRKEFREKTAATVE